jgi:curved DNA-binding protein CbpA
LTQSHYEILGVPYGATHQEIKKAFHSLAIRYHPDVTRLNKTLAEERFKQISQAYWILKDPTRRREYNRTLSVSPREVEVIYNPPTWEKEEEEEEWIWDERQLRYRKKWTVKEGEYEARSPYSFIRNGGRYRRQTLWGKLMKRVNTRVQSIRFWFVRRARITRLRYRLFLDRVFKRRLYAWHSKRPHKILKSRST